MTACFCIMLQRTKTLEGKTVGWKVEQRYFKIDIICIFIFMAFKCIRINFLHLFLVHVPLVFAQRDLIDWVRYLFRRIPNFTELLIKWSLLARKYTSPCLYLIASVKLNDMLLNFTRKCGYLGNVLFYCECFIQSLNRKFTFIGILLFHKNYLRYSWCIKL